MEKINSDYKTISQVAKLLNLINNKTGKTNTHTLRFWEKQFKQIKPIILSGRRRYYDNKSIELLKQIKYLLKDRGMTISGVKKILTNEKSFELDELSNNSIKVDKKNLKIKIKRISKLLKEIKNIK
tara:strand:+ start:561 stop:938 length:378 start_codon:yes stop_codon:yes gene_type:complete